MTTPLKTLARLERDLEEAAGFFEDSGLDTQRERLDRAADLVAEVAASLESLQSGG